jgi:hypothetical protein
MRPCAWLAVVVLGLASSASAQPRRGGPVGPSGLTDRPAAAERREQIKRKIRALRAYTLTEDLALDEQTAGKLFPVLARYDDETDKLLEKRGDIQRRLRHADALRDPRAVDRLIDEAVATQHGFWDLEDRKFAELRKLLTPVQAARLLVVLPALERRIQNQLRKAIVQRRALPPGGPAGNPDDADDDLEPDEVAPRPAPKQPPRRREAPLAPRRAATLPRADAPRPASGGPLPCDPSTRPCR